MDNTEKKCIKILNYRTDKGIAPKPENIVHGEIAIGYKKDNEAIYIKNSTNEIVDFTPTSIVSLTYNELKTLRDNSKLKPSQYYRITDFVTTVANDPEAQSAGHPFDIIVMASKENQLQEECYAIQHEGDTYFANCNLAAWKIWYCLDNDNTKYAWADTINGKGVIYRMIDEWQNDCPYDFKNVQFKRYRVTNNSTNGELSDLNGTYIGYNGDMRGLSLPSNLTEFVWAYTFSFGDRTTTPNDASIIGYNNYELGEGYGNEGYYGDNSIKPTSMVMTVDSSTSSVFCLNNIVWWTNNTRYRSLINGNRIESECFNMTLSGNGTIIEHDCQNFIMGDRCLGNVFGTGGALNTFGSECYSNTFGNNCYGNTFGDYCISNSFGNNCIYNSFGNECSRNTFGYDCTYNTFGVACTYNTFGDKSYHNIFGSNFQYNTLGNDVEYVEIATKKIYHTHILNGTKGTYRNKLTIEFTPEAAYSQFAGFKSDGVLKIWVEADDIVNITYNELKKLRDNSKLRPSQYYRITNFVTTVANDPEAQSAGHPFDIIVMASKENQLQEECYAIQHEGDTYFANCNLAAWKIWYCLDNDNTKYAWADTINGKGVIYRMIDEWQNDCPYDFKNVQFKRYWANGINITKNEGEPKNIILKGYYGTASNTDTGIFTEGIDTNDSLFCFTFTRLNNIVEDYGKGSVTQSNVLDESIQTEGFNIDAGDDKLGIPSAYNFHNRCRNNILKPTEVGLRVDTKEYMALVLLNNVFITVKDDKLEAYQPPFDNTLGVSCVNNTFGNNFNSNSFGNNCSINSFGDNCEHNSFGDYCVRNSFGNGCNNNSFGNSCNSNTFGNNCYSNSFGNSCNSNTFGNNCYSNSFGDYCDSNSFGVECSSNSFGNICNRNTFEGDCYNNSFGGSCSDNTFGDGCYHNSFGNNCTNNSFGGSCSGSTFGGYCSDSTFGNFCGSNSFGNECRSNSFGNFCGGNTFGNECSRNTFGYNFEMSTLGEGVQYVDVAIGETEHVKYVQILNGTQGTRENKLTIAFTPETTYSQFAGFTSDGVLKIWVEADAPHDTVDGGSY